MRNYDLSSLCQHLLWLPTNLQRPCSSSLSIQALFTSPGCLPSPGPLEFSLLQPSHIFPAAW